MATDKERHEVAQRLREFSRNTWPLTVGGNSATIRYAISDIVFDNKKYHSGVDLLNRLADLIEPEPERTCRNLNPPSCRDFECSECGESSEFTPSFMPNYCPNCGARVVEEASDDADR